MAEATVHAEVTGVVHSIPVAVGDRVTAGQPLVIVESMKMEIPQVSPAEGVVAQLHVRPGSFVQEGDRLVTLA
jgi:biotin carboxyl carrier protein